MRAHVPDFYMHVSAYVHMILCLFGGEADCSSSTEKPYPTAHIQNMRRPQMRDIDALKRRLPPRSHAGSLQLLKLWSSPCRTRTTQEKRVWLNSGWRQNSWTEKASGGDQVGQSCLRAAAQKSPQVGNQESGNAAGNIGLLPFLTRTTGRLPCCPAAQLLDGLTSVPTQAEMRELLWRCVPRAQSSPFLHICSEH